MALFNWLFGNKKTPPARAPASDSVVSQFNGTTRPLVGQRGVNATAQPAVAASAARLEQRRTERNAKREQLFQAVRESMVRMGVLSSSFKFKVLSLDQRGRSFLVMIELAAEFSGEAEKLAEIEGIIAQTARHRYDIVVQAVYWRYFNVTTATASAPAPLLGAMHAPISRPAPLYAMNSSATATSASRAGSSDSSSEPTPSSFLATGAFPIIGATAEQKVAARMTKPPEDDLGEDEVLAFRRALAAGAAQAIAPPSAMPKAQTTANSYAATVPIISSAAKAPQPASAVEQAAMPSASAPSTLDKARSKLLLTGYEDTEMADDEPMPALSGTQYGDLR